ncbi:MULTISPECIES: LytTR family DNA-binding domain-containing protein [Reichenbachiella]|uniref:Two component transcriptional regulator, LytTR family n=1 Tax=Reichenbachiella agariperforans TaxID=156994 RepID=A0A1M6TJ05_REIAG|nr:MULTISPECIES: LytTR family DNA-binding domain-containing protein [Reichenbachiella]RJE71475.1 DNA-binding response regulator [Reichenbachiella sp. MSK19-1]SHK56889.1 two component transcriptional regulator, LytTR family [Reichenbachiella agariperforans]
MKIKCITVDDEPLALEIIESYIDRMDCLELVGQFRNAIKAFDFLQSGAEVDLIFLDIQMPKLTGIDFLKTIQNKPKVILTTAYREYALEGFELEVLDYLLKPISFERFMKAVSKYPRESNELTAPPESDDSFIFFKSDKKNIKICLKDVLYIESIKDYVKILTEDKEVVTHHKISELERKLPATDFIRVHRSFIVNIPKIESYSACEIEMTEQSIPVGRNYKVEVLERLGKIVL